MAREVDFSIGTIVGDEWLDDLQEVESALALGVRLEPQGSPPRSVQVPVADDGSETGQGSIRINGAPRFWRAPLSVSLIGRAPATYSAYIVAGSTNPPTLDLRTSAPLAGSRKIGEVDWDGASITAVRNMVDAVPGHAHLHRPGGSDPIDWTFAAETIHMRGTLAARPTAAPANRGWLYYATDTQQLFRSLGTTWEQWSQGPHAASHNPGGADALDYPGIHAQGTLAARPTAAPANAGLLYYATDERVIYRSNGTTWTAWTPGTAKFSAVIGGGGGDATIQVANLVSDPAGAGPHTAHHWTGSDRQANEYAYIDISPGGTIRMNSGIANTEFYIWRASDGASELIVLSSDGNWRKTGLAAGRYILKANKGPWRLFLEDGAVQTVSTSSSTTYLVDHNLGTRDVHVTVYENAGSYREVLVETRHTTENRVTLVFDTAPGANAYRVVVSR